MKINNFLFLILFFFSSLATSLYSQEAKDSSKLSDKEILSMLLHAKLEPKKNLNSRILSELLQASNPDISIKIHNDNHNTTDTKNLIDATTKYSAQEEKTSQTHTNSSYFYMPSTKILLGGALLLAACITPAAVFLPAPPAFLPPLIVYAQTIPHHTALLFLGKQILFNIAISSLAKEENKNDTDEQNEKK